MDFNDRRDGRVKPPHVIRREMERAAIDNAPYRIARGRSSAHIEGLDSRGNYGSSAGTDQGRGYVEYEPQSACSGLTRLGAMVSRVSGHQTPGEAANALRSGVYGKPCQTCLKNADIAEGR